MDPRLSEASVAELLEEVGRRMGAGDGAWDLVVHVEHGKLRSLDVGVPARRARFGRRALDVVAPKASAA